MSQPTKTNQSSEMQVIFDRKILEIVSGFWSVSEAHETDIFFLICSMPYLLVITSPQNRQMLPMVYPFLTLRQTPVLKSYYFNLFWLQSFIGGIFLSFLLKYSLRVASSISLPSQLFDLSLLIRGADCFSEKIWIFGLTSSFFSTDLMLTVCVSTLTSSLTSSVTLNGSLVFLLFNLFSTFIIQINYQFQYTPTPPKIPTPKNTTPFLVLTSSCLPTIIILDVNIIMDNFGFYLHSLIKKQTKEIIRKIDAKNYYEMRKSRSEGLEIAGDYTHKLRCAVRRSKTEKLTFLEQKNLRKRLVTDLNDRHLKRFSTGKDSEGSLKQNKEQLRILAYQQPDETVAEQPAQKEEIGGNLEKEQEDGGFIAQGGSCQQQYQLEKRSEQIQLSKISKNLAKYSGNKSFLPILSLYIQEQKLLPSLNAQGIQIRSLIVTMMVLAINRRKNGRLLDALDILLQSQVYFPKESQEMIRLKSVWLELIGKIYQQIKKSFKSSTGRSRWKRTTRKSSMNLQESKRQKTIFIRSLASRKAFFDKFSQTMRKSKLVFETTFLAELNNQQNRVIINEQGNKNVMRIDRQNTVTFPSPKDVYPQEQGLQNYAIVMVNKDKQANIFPLNYPNSLAGFLHKQDYLQKIIKINSYLIPCTRCLNFQSSLFIYFQLILSIFLVLFIIALIVINCSKTTSIVAIVIIIIIAILISAKINSKGKDNAHFIGKAHQLLQRHCKEWQQQYEPLQIKFVLNNDLDIFLITFPVDIQIASDGTSNVLDSNAILSKYQSFKEESRRCSIKLSKANFENPLDEINQDGSSDDDEPNQEFWRKAESDQHLNQQIDQNERFDIESSSQSIDQVVPASKKQAQPLSSLQVELIPFSPQQQP